MARHARAISTAKQTGIEEGKTQNMKEGLPSHSASCLLLHYRQDERRKYDGRTSNEVSIRG